MIASLAFVLLFASPAGPADDYFPLAVGTKWYYADDSDVRSGYVDEVAEIADVGGKPAAVIVTKSGIQTLGSAVYRIEGDTVFLLGYDKKKPMAEAHPILKVGERSASWEFKGATPVGTESLPLEFKAVSAAKGKRKVLGDERETLEVKMEATILEVAGIVISVKQTILYAKGVGMYEMTESSSSGKRTHTRKVKLIRFEPPK